MAKVQPRIDKAEVFRTKRPRTYDHAEIFRLIDDEKLSQGEVARRLGVNQSHVSKLLKRRRRAAQANGHTPTTALQRAEIVAEPVSAPPAHGDAPVHRSASERIMVGIWEKLETRVEVLEAFMAAQQSTQRTLSASAHSEALQRTEPVEWISQGSHFAADMLPRIKAYMARYRLEKREVVDLALRRLLAEEDQYHG